MTEIKSKKMPLQIAKEVLLIEANALFEMTNYLDNSFSKVIDTIFACKGRTILMGMGKSGHIANKIASTLASTGTPAFFIHPAEAAHGDLGMIVTGDVVLILSNSGESDEILTLIPVLKRKNVQIIVITSRKESTLAKIADYHIWTKINQEACPLGLAPTTSTTVNLAIGDAIAICLLKQRNFTSNDFALSHPAGTLGKSLLMKVEDLMVKDNELPIVYPDETLKEAIIVMTNKGLGSAVIVDQDKHILGIFTDGDLRRLFQNQEEIKNLTIKNIMTVSPKIVSPTVLASEALHIMKKNNITSLLVTDQTKKLLGIVTMHHILKTGII